MRRGHGTGAGFLFFVCNIFCILTPNLVAAAFHISAGRCLQESVIS